MSYLSGANNSAFNKEEPSFRSTPVYLTVKTDEQSLKIGLNAGAWDYISKSFDTTVLLQKVIAKAARGIGYGINNQEHNTDVFALEVGLCRMQLYRKLKALAGQSTTSFLNSIKVKYALQMFDQVCDRIQEAMDAVGDLLAIIQTHQPRAQLNQHPDNALVRLKGVSDVEIAHQMAQGIVI